MKVAIPDDSSLVDVMASLGVALADARCDNAVSLFHDLRVESPVLGEAAASLL